jgi:hypothetical protein
MDIPENNLVALQTHREITSLLKSFLEIIEDLKNNHKIMLKKMTVNVDESYIKDVDYLTPDFFEHLRKRVLDKSNNTDRTILAFLDLFDFQINPQKLQEATQKTKIVKKICVNSYITDTI